MSAGGVVGGCACEPEQIVFEHGIGQLKVLVEDEEAKEEEDCNREEKRFGFCCSACCCSSAGDGGRVRRTIDRSQGIKPVCQKPEYMFA